MDGLTLNGKPGPQLRDSFRAAGLLLSVAGENNALRRKRNPFPPLAHLLANIFLCAIAEPYLADDPGGIYLPLFVVVQWSAAVLITLSFAGGIGTAILRNTRLYPGSATAGYYFLLAATMRRPEWYLFAAFGILFPAALFARGIISFAGIALLTAIPVLLIQVLCCAAAVRMVRAARPLAGLVLFTAVIGAVVLGSVFVFRSAALAAAVPMAGWVASGIRAFSGGNPGEGSLYLLAVAGVASVVLGIFRK